MEIIYFDQDSCIDSIVYNEWSVNCLIKSIMVSHLEKMITLQAILLANQSLLIIHSM